MFKRVISRDKGCPWGTTGLSTQTWLHVPLNWVKMSDLIATQPGIMFDGILHPQKQVDPHPHVVVWDDEFYLEDGHHRVVRQMIQGVELLHARVLWTGGKIEYDPKRIIL